MRPDVDFCTLKDEAHRVSQAQDDVTQRMFLGSKGYRKPMVQGRVKEIGGVRIMHVLARTHLLG